MTLERVFATVVFSLGIGCLGCPISSDVPKTLRQVQRLAEEWQPPADDIETERLFHGGVAGYRVALEDEKAKLEEFGFEQPGRHAEYRSGDQKIEVFVYKGLNKEVLQNLFKSIESAFLKSGGDGKPRTFSNRSDHWDYRSADGRRYNFFPKRGWLILFRSPDTVQQLPFAEEYLRGLHR